MNRTKFRAEFAIFLKFMRRTYNRKVYKACIRMLQPGAPFACSQRVRELQLSHSVRSNAYYRFMSCN